MTCHVGRWFWLGGKDSLLPVLSPFGLPTATQFPFNSTDNVYMHSTSAGPSRERKGPKTEVQVDQFLSYSLSFLRTFLSPTSSSWEAANPEASIPYLLYPFAVGKLHIEEASLRCTLR